MKNLILSGLLLLVAILINNGILITTQSDSYSASFGVILLLGSLLLAIVGIRKYGKDWNQRKRTLIHVLTLISIIFIYLFVSALISFSESKNPQNVDSSTVMLKESNLTNARNDFINGLNKTLSNVSEQSNGFYSVVASFDDDIITFTYKIEIENDISLNDDPIDALVKEAVNTFNENGTIKILRDLKFKTLVMSFKGKNKENFRNINLEKI